LYNQYGPTETTIDALVGRCSQEKVTLGKPIDNAVCYIVDKYKHLVPVGVVGELYIGGDGVARGYLNKPELTIEKFFSSSLLRFSASQLLSFSLYRTGDLARWLPAGKIEFLGRMDEQVKIRGFRVEPGEIENRLLRHPGVKEAVVAAGEKETGDNYLCAYIVPVNIEKVVAEEFREYLSHSLPDYMVPSYFVIIDNIPLTSHGKVDRKALPMPEMESRSEYIAPGDRIELLLAEIWGEILGVEKERIGIDHHFFELGGHSLKATVMIARVHKELDVRVPLAEIFKTPTIRGFALSSAQKRLYILQQMDLNSTAYNMPEMIPLEETPDFSFEPERLENTFKKLIARHESLRTSFHMVNNQPVQKVHDEVEFEISLVPRIIRPFDLSQAPLLRVGLVKLEEKRYLLWVDMHHIISDGASHSVLVQDFVSLYRGETPLPLRIQYKDYAYWQNSDKERAAIRRQELYWLNQFADEIPVLDIPTDYPRPAVQSFDGSSVSFQVPPHHTAALKAIAMEKGTGATMYMVLLALGNILLAKLSSQEDIVIGTPVAGRRHADLERVIGMFVNTLALRNQPAGDKTFAAFLPEVKEKTLQAFENQEYPFEDLVDRVAVNRDAGRNPLFDVMLVFQDAGDTQTVPYEDEMHRYENTIAKFDITLSAVEVGGGLRFAFSYCTKLFKQETIERFINYFKKIISSVIANPNQPISEIEIVSEEEKHRLLYDFNQRDTEYPADKTLHQLFEEQVRRTPDGIALVGKAQSAERRAQSKTRHAPCAMRHALSYDLLNRKSNQLAHYLYQQGAKANHLVGIMADRSLEMIVGILGILKAGCAYVPLDPKAPEVRVGYILEECSVKILVSKVSRDIEVIDLTQQTSPTQPTHLTHPTQLCYVIFTSGSTGKPKGVPITHANLSPLLHWGYRHLGLNADDRVIRNLAYYFDWSVWEIFITLTSGAGLFMISEELQLNPEKSIAFMNENRITVLHVTPSQYRYYLAAGRKLETLRYLFIGAEALSVDLVKRSFESVRDHCRVFNMYGPTETAIIASALEVDRANVEKFKGLSNVPIGRPVANTDFLILDKYLKLCPVNVTGELYIGGDGLSPGYLNKPELTKEKFIKSFAGVQGAVFQKSPLVAEGSLYKTGDLARWLPDPAARGAYIIEFLGRTDFQVKVRGYRIELGEIESQLLKHPEVKEVVVLAGEKESSDKYLCAYIVPTLTAAGASGPHSPHSPNLKEYLSHSLPDYMIPSYFIEIERIPVNPNGKIDRKALPAPEITVEKDFAAPQDEMEEKLVSIWSEVLEIEKEIIGIDDDFFQRGGHSLKATLLVSRIREELGAVVPLVEVFKTPTVRQLAVCTREACREIERVKDEHLVLLRKTSADDGHLFFIHDGTGEVEGYMEFCNYLNNDFNCWGLRAARQETIEVLAETYIERMKKIQPRGPYFIAGWSIGGTIAFEMARQLEEVGEETAFLALIDTAPPMPVKKRASKGINPALQQLVEHSITTHLDIETVRALDEARNRYQPGGKINAAAHYFSAIDSRVPNKNQWSGYFKGKLEFHPVCGDHFSIFKMPEVTAFAEMFDDVLTQWS
jgi:amino acid adenylation domain-containing protein